MSLSDLHEERLVFSPERMKLSDFPQIASYEITVECDGREWSYQIEPGSEYVHCPNPRCNGGAFRLGQIVRVMYANTETEREKTVICEGHEGSPKGKRKGLPCANHFHVKIKIEYKSA